MVITLKTCQKTQKMMDEFYNEMKREKTPQYALFQADDGDTVVTLYSSGKAVFQGKRKSTLPEPVYCYGKRTGKGP